MSRGTYPHCRFTSLYRWMRQKFTMCLKFQLDNTLTPATVAAAMCSASWSDVSVSAPASMYRFARFSTSRVISISSKWPGSMDVRISRTAWGARGEFP